MSESMYELFDRDHVGSVVPKDHNSVDPLELMAHIREKLSELPTSASTWKLSDVLETDEGDDYNHLSVSDDMITLLGSWRLPDRHNPNRAMRYVNPKTSNKAYYSDVFVECPCGAFIAREEKIQGDAIGDAEHDHADDCTRADRLRARADLLDRRAEIVEEMLLLGLPASEASERMAMSGRTDRNIGPFADGMNIDTERLKEKGVQRRINTESMLVAMGYSLEEVGVVWDISGEAVRSRLHRLGDYSVVELRSIEPPEGWTNTTNDD